MTKIPEIEASNPLSGYFSIPGLHVSLPTKGAFMPAGSIDFAMNGDLPVLPMKASDEMLLRNPDALMSGDAIVNMIASCVPAIKKPKLISAPDLEVILLGIRAATYGPQMEMTVKCEKCEHESTFDCHLPNLLATMTDVPPINPVSLNEEITVFVKPYTLEVSMKISQVTFEQFRILQAVDASGADEDTQRKARQRSFEIVSKLNLDMLAQSIERVVIPNGEVTNSAHIAEFLRNISAAWVNKIDEKLQEINALGIDKNVEVTCQNEKCGHVWTTRVEFNHSTFFAVGS